MAKFIPKICVSLAKGRIALTFLWTFTYINNPSYPIVMGGAVKMLFTKESINNNVLEQWQNDAIATFSSKMADKNSPFPCIPATQGFHLYQFRYGFASDPRNISSADGLAKILGEYSNCFRNLGNYTSLIIFYETSWELKEQTSVEGFEKLFWKQLYRLAEIDCQEWPRQIPTDPHNPLWEFCFHGEQYFVYCATPSHKNRMSRHFPYFMLAITPRSVLVEFHSSKHHAAKIKSNIRKRLTDYDTIGIHPDLNSYGNEDNFEWKQYFLHDDNTAISTCPFHKSNGQLDKNFNNK